MSAPGEWVELRLGPIPRGELDRASGLLFEAGCAGLQELDPDAPPPAQPWEAPPAAPEGPTVVLLAWFERPDRAAVEAALTGLGPLAWASAPDVPWEEAWREGFEPLRIAEDGVELLFAPPWDPRPGAILLEPGQGFGTGQHPSTRMALRLLVRLRGAARTVLDVGTGSGILALAAARLGLAARGVDVEEAAVAEAVEHARLNGLALELSTTPVRELVEPADLVLANLHAELLVELAPELRRLARRHLVLAGVLADREALVRAAFDPWAPLRWREADGRWVALAYSRP